MTAPTLPSEGRSPGTTRTNRVVLALLGLVLLLGGIAALLVGLGAFGGDRANSPVLAQQATDFADRNAGWFWPLIALAAIIIGLLALRWLIIQARSNRLSTLDLEADRSRGRTRLEADALTDAIADEIESYRGVDTASARLTGRDAGLRLRLRVQLDGRVEFGQIRHRIETEALTHAREALSTDHLPTRMELVVPRRAAAASVLASAGS